MPNNNGKRVKNTSSVVSSSDSSSSASYVDADAFESPAASALLNFFLFSSSFSCLNLHVRLYVKIKPRQKGFKHQNEVQRHLSPAGWALERFARPAVIIPLPPSLTTGFAPPIFRNHTCCAVLRTLFVNLMESMESIIIIVLDLIDFIHWTGRGRDLVWSN